MKAVLLLPPLLLLASCKAADATPAKPAEGQLLAAPRSSAGARVEVAKLEPSTARLEFTLPGEVEGSHDAKLAAALGGYVEAVLVEEGDDVKKGQALLRVETSMYATRRDQAKADFEQVQSEVKRLESMGESVSRAQREQMTTRLKIAESSYRAAEIQLGRSIITAPFDGKVASIGVEQGEVAPPGAPVLRLVQLAPAKVTVSVADRDVVALKKGLPVTVTTDAAGEPMQGTITFVSPVGDLKTRAFSATIEVPNIDRRLLPGMIARVRLASEVEGSSIVLPQHVMVTRMNSVGVFVAEEDTAAWRPLKIGTVVGNQVVVESGVSAGEMVVVAGHRELVEGDKVVRTREGVCCKDGRVSFAKEEMAR